MSVGMFLRPFSSLERLHRSQEIAIYVDHALDESYTPQKISIRCGTSVEDLKEVSQETFNDPKGWIVISLQKEGEEGGEREGGH